MFYDIDIENVTSYADNNTPYTSSFNLEEVLKKLELSTESLFGWFKDNDMKDNTEGCHLNRTHSNLTAKSDNLILKTAMKKNF